jgi:DnaJ-class molecular chaperone
MASSDDRERAENAEEQCMPCRGTGRVISNLGGSPQEVPCPWCKGGGVRLAGVDAQAAWLEGEGRDAPTDASPDDAPPQVA